MTTLPDRTLQRLPENSRRRRLGIAAKIALLMAFVALTNWGFGERAGLLLDQSRYGTLLAYILVWGAAVLALMVAAFQPNLWMRLWWTALIALSSTAAWAYHSASQSEFTVFDIVSLWNARHETGRALEFYSQFILPAAVLLASGLLLMALPIGVTGRMATWLRRLFWFPAVPVALIAAIVLMKDGGGSQAMPSQFTPMALTTLAGAKIALQGAPVRKEVAWVPQAQYRPRNIVMLVDESIRYDYLDFTPGNPHTPKLAGLARRFADFGPAVSGGICSNYSNAILRFAASRKDVTGTINTNPTLWQFARKAGYRTVFVDAQAGGITNPGLLQNFMSMAEKAQIDTFRAIRDVASDRADLRLAEIIAEELRKPGPVFIYANKNGAHFPYDEAYPVDRARYQPTVAEGGNTFEARVASYRNAIAWSVDDFMADLFGKADFSNAILVYTSDHAQNLDPKGITHCRVENPDPRMALVPLMVAASDPLLQAELRQSAAERFGAMSHFQIAPSILSWMGYDAADLATVYDESLTRDAGRKPAFTAGDVFGLFSDRVRWTEVDTSIDYLDPPARVLRPADGLALEGAHG